jgi:CRP/FNR family cyclic AMP-dependent transcriptional regulator
MSVLDTIKASPLFYELYDAEVETIVEHCSVMTLEDGEHIVTEGEHGNEIFIILSGHAEVRKGQAVLAGLGKGDLFGELVLLGETLRTADIVATTYTDVLVLDYDSIFGLFKSQPKIFSLLILNLSRLLTKRLKQAGSDIKELRTIIDGLEKKSAA